MTKEPFDISTESTILFHLLDECRNKHGIECLSVGHIQEFAQKFFSQGREQGIEEAYQHCHGVAMNLSNLKETNDYKAGTLHGAVACENGIYRLKSKEVSGKEGT